MKYIIAFDTTQEAILAENILLSKNIKVRVTSLPSEIRSGCGIALYLEDMDNLEYQKNVEIILTENDIKYKIYEIY